MRWGLRMALICLKAAQPHRPIQRPRQQRLRSHRPLFRRSRSAYHRPLRHWLHHHRSLRPKTKLNQLGKLGKLGKRKLGKLGKLGSGGRWLGKAVLLIAGIAAGAYWFGAGKTVDGPDACAILLTQAQAALAQPGGASQVLVLTQNAASLCTDAPRSAQLQALQKTATAQVQQAQKQQQQAEKQAAQQRQAQAREAARQRAEQAAQQAREAAAQQAAQQAASSAAEARLLQGFLADAQQHLRQQQFDKAKAFVESAQRIAPNAPEVQRLKRQIQTQEMQYLRQNTTIQ